MAPQISASQYGDRQSHWLDEAREATVVEHCVIHKEDPLDKLPSMPADDVEVVLRQREVKTMIDVPVSNALSLINDHITSALQSCMIEGQPRALGSVVSTTIETVVHQQAGEKWISELVKDAAGQAVASRDVISTVVENLIVCNKFVGSVARFLESIMEEETCEVENFYKTEGTVAEVAPSHPPWERSDSEFCCST